MLRQKCKRGHSLTDPANVYVTPSTGVRECRTCRRARARGDLEPAPLCWAGLHDLTDPANVNHGGGTTRCLPCRREQNAAHHRARRAAA